MIPQNAFNNQVKWKIFEDYCRNILKDKKCDSVEVISGPIFNSGIKNSNIAFIIRNIGDFQK